VVAHTLDDTTKDRVFAIQPLCRNGRNKKLTPVGTRARICHADSKGLVVTQTVNNFVVEFATPNAFSTRPVTQWVSRLDIKR
jgi:hypothetical protein